MPATYFNDSAPTHTFILYPSNSDISKSMSFLRIFSFPVEFKNLTSYSTPLRYLSIILFASFSAVLGNTKHTSFILKKSPLVFGLIHQDQCLLVV